MDRMKWWDRWCERYVDEGSACELCGREDVTP